MARSLHLACWTVAASLSACAQSATGTAVPAPAQRPAPAITPPSPARIFDDFATDRDERERQIANLSKRAQPDALAQAIADLQQGSTAERVAKLRAKALADLVFVEGGTFVMGEASQMRGKFDRNKYSAEQLTVFRNLFDRMPGHEVTLSSFWISRYKTTFAEFDVFSHATGAEPAPTSEFDLPYKASNIPAGVPWSRADAYCRWLGTITGRPFSLPTEAQWEYAARSRGQKFIYATDDGHLRQGVNTAIKDVSRAFAVTAAGRTDDNSATYPVGLFAPTPLGLYDMNGNGGDWVSDWYDPTYYDYSPALNPTGPVKGERRVVRGFIDSSMHEPHVLMRRSRAPDALRQDPNNRAEKYEGTSMETGFRCAVQSSP